jgi:4-methylaminobutanoate oxidase (formaldehyde-forming)
VVEEVRAVRERAGIIDLSSFGKIAVEGPAALGLLQRVAANDVDRQHGSLVYTQFCSDLGGIVADVTVTRMADDRFRVVTGAGYVASEIAWLRTHAGDDEDVAIRDVSGDFATIGLWGPRARDLLAAATPDDVTDMAIPLRSAREIRLGPALVLASRISYAGELGWELTMDTGWAVAVWDRLRAAGEGYGLEPFGYRALDSLRMEKGYRYFGTDLTMLETPFEAGLGVFVRLDKGPFIGRDALRAARDAHPDGPAIRLRMILIGGAEYLPIYGGEAVRLDGAVIGRLRSVAFGPTVSRTIGSLYCSASLTEGSRLQVDVFDQRIPAIVAADVLVDPRGERMRG